WDRKYKEKYRQLSRYDFRTLRDAPADRKGEDVFVPTNLIKGKLGERPVINLEGALAGLVEPGIYFFIEDRRYRGPFSRSYRIRPTININTVFEKPCAMLGYSIDFHPTMFVGIKYLAVGVEASERLREIGKTTEYFYHTFDVEEKNEEDQEIIEQATINKIIEQATINRIMEDDELKAERERELEDLLNKDKASVVISGTPGIDYRGLTVYYKTLLGRAHDRAYYDFVYVVKNKLYLEKVKTDDDAGISGAYIEQYVVDIDTITNLSVSAETLLKNGEKYPVNIEVFDRQQTVKEMFIKEDLLGIVDEMDCPNKIYMS
ncbi:MAG: hypothetical protein K6G22_00640, partial [Lachnospiraceae bacterium]|nr:hypothetical protein [Lachnospiraceae bacterium]